jgi:hypothetical protein
LETSSKLLESSLKNKKKESKGNLLKAKKIRIFPNNNQKKKINKWIDIIVNILKNIIIFYLKM